MEFAYDGKQKSMAFGSYPLVSLSDARTKRDEACIVLSDGRDPAVAKKLKIEAAVEAARQTFERAARRWHENARGQWARRHANDVMRSLERDVFPAIGSLPIPDLTPPLILAALREIEARGSIETAKRVLALGGGAYIALSGSYAKDRVEYRNDYFSPGLNMTLTAGCYCNRTAAIDLSGDTRLFRLPGGWAKAAIGIGYRNTFLRNDRGASYPLNFERSQANAFAYGELNLPLVAPATGVAGVSRLNVSAALRW